MTRHGMGKSTAAGLTPPATDPHASVVIIAADRVATSRVPCRQSRADAQRSDLPASIAPLSGCARATAPISRRAKSP
ncbi:hypothetical protein B0E45_08280 [Sinorhizobium sp. A49]|nr:hypothetical protein B0E45_08280 [Sinorhizobium sp. A49]